MDVTLTSVERIHSIGKKKRGKNRPFILRLYNFQEKAELLRNAHKLKDSGLSLSDDYSQQVHAKRKHLWQYAKAKKEDGHAVKLSFDKLTIDGKT